MQDIHQQQDEQRKTESGRTNVGKAERWASAIGGGALLLYGLSRRSIRGTLLGALGGAVAYRGVSGTCPLYTSLGISTAPDDRPLATQLEERGTKVERTITVNRTPEELYNFWRNFANLPTFMNNLAAVDVLDNNFSHWVAEGPVGKQVHWDAVITDDRKNELIGWRSLPNADVESVGRVEFNPCRGSAATEVKVSLAYSPLGGKAGIAVAKFLGTDPARQIQEDMRRFQQLMETGDIPSTRRQSSGRAEEKGSQQNDDPRRFAWGTRDNVDEASWESFPASDPPAW